MPVIQISAQNAIPQSEQERVQEVVARELKLPQSSVRTLPEPCFMVEPIGHVENERKELVDDDWGPIESVIHLRPDLLDADCAAGLEGFSHVEVVFYMDRVEDAKIVSGSRHPRNNSAWPKVGILAQRGKNRPNKIGVTRCECVRVDGFKVTVRGLDAVSGTPVLDLKPVLREFETRGTIVQPEWSVDIMKNYF